MSPIFSMPVGAEDEGNLLLLLFQAVENACSWTVAFFVFYIFCVFSLKTLVLIVNYVLHSYSMKHNEQLFPTLSVDWKLCLSIKSINLNEATLKKINAKLHYVCQFEKFSIELLEIQLIPRLRVTVNGIVFKGYALPPSQWSAEESIQALRCNRIEKLDRITRQIQKRIFQGYSVLKNVEGVAFATMLGGLHVIDIVLGGVSLEFRNINAFFCTMKKSNIAVLAHMEGMIVRPCSDLHMAMFSPMFKMKADIENISLSCRSTLNNDLVSPPMLNPMNASCVVMLPKVISQMIRPVALSSKYCDLHIEVQNLHVDLDRTNLESLLNFSLAIIFYRQWLCGVERFFEKSLENSHHPEIDALSSLTNYVALYSNYAQVTYFNLHVDQSRSIFGPGIESERAAQIRKKCLLYEEHMTTEDIMQSRALALGWKEKQHDFFQRENITWSCDKEFYNEMTKLFWQEYFAHKEIRHVNVVISASKAELLLSTPRTMKSSFSMPTKDTETIFTGKLSSNKSTGKLNDSEDNPVALTLCGIYVEVIDPCVPALLPYDTVRDVVVKINRLRLSSPQPHTQSPPSDSMYISETILDKYTIQPSCNKSEHEDNSLLDDRFENASSCSDLHSIPRVKTNKTVFSSEKFFARVLKSSHYFLDKEGTNALGDAENASDIDMVALFIHEDPEYESLVVDAALSNAILLINSSNIMALAEYGLQAANSSTLCIHQWQTAVDMLDICPDRKHLPTCIFGGKQMKVMARLKQFAVGLQEPRSSRPNSCAKVLLLYFESDICLTSNSRSESLSGHITNPYLSSYEFVKSNKSFHDRREQMMFDLCLRHCELFADHFYDHLTTFQYSLFRDDDYPPKIFEDDEILNENSESCDLDCSIDTSLRNATKEDSEISSILFRDLSLKSDSFVVCISQQELNIFVHWLEHSIASVDTRKYNISWDFPLPNHGNESQPGATVEEFQLFICKLFNALGISDDEKVYPRTLRNLFLSDCAKSSLLEKEICEHENDLMFLFDPEMKGYTTLKYILSNALAICGKCGLDVRGKVVMECNEFVGANPPPTLTDAPYDCAALNNFWKLLEDQCQIRRKSGSLCGIPSATFQMMLVRLCGNATLARILWEKVVRNNMKDKNEKLYPWLLDDKQTILHVPALGAILRQALAATSDAMCPFYQVKKTSDEEGLKQRIQASMEETLNSIDMSITRFDIDVGTIQFNYLDPLLGPILPRFQVSITDSSFYGSFLHFGIYPDLSFSSNYGLVSRLFGGVMINSFFFNSAVCCHEPIIEPFSVALGAIKVPNDHTEFLIHVKDLGKLTLNISAALLQTMSSAVFSIVDNHTSSQRSELCGNKMSLGRDILGNGAPSFVVINQCGVDLLVQTFIAYEASSISDSFDPISRVVVSREHITPIRIPWTIMYRTYSEHSFPEVLLSSQNMKDSSFYFSSGSPVQMHSMFVDTIFLTKVMNPKRNKRSSNKKKNSSSVSSSELPHRIYDEHHQFKPAIILENKSSHGLDCGIVFLARSNVQIQNMTGSDLKIRLDSVKSNSLELCIRNFEMKSLPIPLVSESQLTCCIQGKDNKWSDSISLIGLFSRQSHHIFVGGMLLYVESKRHFDSEDKVEIFDYVVEVVLGVRVFNGLPYCIEMRHAIERVDDGSKSSAPESVTKVESGCEYLLPIKVVGIDSLKLSLRIDNIQQFSPSHRTHKCQYSNPLDLSRFLDDTTHNISTEDITIYFPHDDGNIGKRVIRARKIRDSSKESLFSRYKSTPSIEFSCDLWVQNKSGIPLTYRFKDSKGRCVEAEDNEFNYASGFLGNNDMLDSSNDGPILGMLDCEKIQIKISNHRKVDASKISIRFSDLKTLFNVPNIESKGNAWSKSVLINSNSFISGELECDGVWFGVSVKSGIGAFKSTLIVMITPRYIIRNLTLYNIDFFPVKLWKRMRKSSTDDESQGMRKLAKTNEKSHPAATSASEEQLSLHHILQDEKPKRQESEKHYKGNEESYEVSSSSIIPSKNHSACTFYTFLGSQRGIVHMLNTEYPALSMRINESSESTLSTVNSISINVVAASNLMRSDLIGSSDPFCEIFWQGELVHTTAVVSNSLNPLWNESVDLHIKPDTLSMSELRVIVYDHDLHQKEFLGQVTLRYAELMESPGVVLNKNLMKMPQDSGKGKAQGFLSLRIDYVRDESYNTWTAPVPIGNPVMEAISARTSDGERHLLSVEVEENGPLNIITVSEHSLSNLPAFMVVNKVQDVQLRFRQKHTSVRAYPRQIVRPMEYLYYAWDDCNLPKVIELVAVDKHGVESPVESYAVENVGKKHHPLNVSMLDCNKIHLLTEVTVDGHTRKLIVSNDTKGDKKDAKSKKIDLEDVNFRHFRVVCTLSGLSLSIIDETPQELIHFAIDDLAVWSHANSNVICFTVKHIQLDNMLSDADYPVVLFPSNSGYNSHLNEYYNHFSKECIPFLGVTMDLDMMSLARDTIIAERIEVNVQDLSLFIDFNFIVRLASSMITPSIIDATNRILRVIYKPLDLNDMKEHLSEALVQETFLPRGYIRGRQVMVFFKDLVLHAVAFKMTLAIALKKSTHIDIDPHRIGSQVEYSTVSRLASLSRGIQNISPHFYFGSISISNAFDTLRGVGWRLAKFYISSAGLQALRVLGSAEIIGDPAGGLLSLGSSIRLFAIKTKSELDGHSPVRAEGLKHLVQGLANISFGTVSKVANSVGEHLASVTGSDFKFDMAAKSPSHVGKGALQGGSIFFKSLGSGVKNVYLKPMEGFRKRSVRKTAKGFVTGISGLALAPIVGALGATAKLTQGIEATAHVFDDKPVGRLRPARSLFYSPQVRPLEDSIFLVSFSIVFRGADFSYTPSKGQKSFMFQNTESSDFTRHTDGEDNLHEALSVSTANDVKHLSKPPFVVVVHVKYGSKEKVTKELVLSPKIRLAEEDMVRFDFKIKSRKDKFEKRMLQINVNLKYNSVFGSEVTVARGLLHPLDLINFLSYEDKTNLHESKHDDAENVMWQYKMRHANHQASNSPGNRHEVRNNDFNSRIIEPNPNAIVNESDSAKGVSILHKGDGHHKMSQYLQSMIEKPIHEMSEQEKQALKKLDAYVTYPQCNIKASIKKSFLDLVTDVRLRSEDIFSIDCNTRVAANNKNAQELHFLREMLQACEAVNASSSSDSASSLTVSTPSLSQSGRHIHHSFQRFFTKSINVEDQAELFQTAEGLRFRLYLSGSFSNAPSTHVL